MKSQITNHKSQNGFTLIETLVAITVLLLSITAPLQIASQALFSAFYVRDEITAYYLAEEAIEYIKNSRDTRFLEDVFNSGVVIEDNAWLVGLGECIENPTITKGCTVDATKPFMSDPEAIVSCNVSGCLPIRFDESSGIWNYVSGDVSKFTRTIELKPQTNNGGTNEEALIEVTVEWQGNNAFVGAKKVFISALISNWQRK